MGLPALPNLNIKNVTVHITSSIKLKDSTSVLLKIHAKNAEDFPDISGSDYKHDNTQTIHIYEGIQYEYELDNYKLKEISGIISRSFKNEYEGRIWSLKYVGLLKVSIVDAENNEKGSFFLDLRSKTINHDLHYKQMLKDIAENSIELILNSKTATLQSIVPSYDDEPKALYQKFAFLKAFIEDEEFNYSIQKILSNPATRWITKEETQDIRSIKRMGSVELRKLCSGTRRILLPLDYPLEFMKSVPDRIEYAKRHSSIDILENQFIKHALYAFLTICNHIKDKAEEDRYLYSKAEQLIKKLESLLSAPFFKELSPLKIIPLNSPILQRKEGYREVLRIWLMHEIASSITWQGGDDVYLAGKRDIATLYEYWVFFKLLDIVKNVFSLSRENIDQLMELRDGGINLALKQGQHTAIKGFYETTTRKLNVEFAYNKSFSFSENHTDTGTWTKDFRPDYTLSIWPEGVEAYEAEKDNTMVHIHFDAKYRIGKITEQWNDDSSVADQQQESKSEKDVRRVDLLKMHAYKDAIRRTAGSYVIYPGTKTARYEGFHEVVPGLGAFPLLPGNNAEQGRSLESFLKRVANHVLDRASQREKIALKFYETYIDKNENQLIATMPELTGDDRDLIPDETYVLVGWVKNITHRTWIIDKQHYNIRAGEREGSMRLTPEFLGVKYLLLHDENSSMSGDIYRLNKESARFWSGNDLLNDKYFGEEEPPDKTKEIYEKHSYIVFELEAGETSSDFDNILWDVTKLPGFDPQRKSHPIVVSLTQLMNAVVS
ncbi:MAG: DUF2357 domain-containing protein [Candidatus Cloacimonadaceae bacterium]